MIAKNLLKYAQAMAVQMVLPFKLRMLRSARPTTRLGRAARSARAATRRTLLAIKVIYPVKVKRATRPKKAEVPWLQLTLWLGKNSLLSTRNGDVWIQTEMTV